LGSAITYWASRLGVRGCGKYPFRASEKLEQAELAARYEAGEFSCPPASGVRHLISIPAELFDVNLSFSLSLFGPRLVLDPGLPWRKAALAQLQAHAFICGTI
jgi:hypothetical protein